MGFWNTPSSGLQLTPTYGLADGVQRLTGTVYQAGSKGVLVVVHVVPQAGSTVKVGPANPPVNVAIAFSGGGAGEQTAATFYVPAGHFYKVGLLLDGLQSWTEYS